MALENKIAGRWRKFIFTCPILFDNDLFPYVDFRKNVAILAVQINVLPCMCSKNDYVTMCVY